LLRGITGWVWASSIGIFVRRITILSSEARRYGGRFISIGKRTIFYRTAEKKGNPFKWLQEDRGGKKHHRKKDRGRRRSKLKKSTLYGLFRGHAKENIILGTGRKKWE